MSSIGKADINEMDRLMKILDGNISESTKPEPKILSNGEESIILSKNPTRNDIDKMAEIMNNFSSVTGVKSFKNLYDAGNKIVDNLIKESTIDRNLKEALITKKTDDGVQIGAWEIIKKIREGKTNKKETIYCIRNTNTHEVLRAKFLILESVKAIVSLLNNGSSFNDLKIKNIIKLEIDYRRLRDQALEEKVFWHKAKKKNNEFKMDLYEAKFEASKAKALYIKEKIKNIYHRL